MRRGGTVHAPEILPSILACDLAHLADEVARLGPSVRTLHVDVMDGRYVPNISFGQPVMRSLRAVWSQDLDVHLMIIDPSRYASDFVAGGATSVAFHPEVEDDPLALVRRLRSEGVRVGVGVRPEHPLESVAALLPEIDVLLLMTVNPGFAGQPFLTDVLPKITEAFERRAQDALGFRIQVDGGVTASTVGAAATAGADWFVAGTSVFAAADPAGAAEALLVQAQGAMRTSDAALG
jgi:ribulose-phosphate 3-epimerase